LHDVALRQPGALHDREALKQALALGRRDGAHVGVQAQAVPLEARGPERAVGPLGLHGAPQAQHGHVLGEQDERGPLDTRDAPLPGDRCQAGEADRGAVVGRGVVERVIVGGAEVDLVGGQQRRQPRQFPDVPRAPLACR
jgi:hypothetical protein